MSLNVLDEITFWQSVSLFIISILDCCCNLQLTSLLFSPWFLQPVVFRRDKMTGDSNHRSSQLIKQSKINVVCSITILWLLEYRLVGDFLFLPPYETKAFQDQVISKILLWDLEARSYNWDRRADKQKALWEVKHPSCIVENQNRNHNQFG